MTIRILAILLLLTASCEKQEKKKQPNLPKELGFIKAVDVSSYPEIAAANTLYYDSNSVAVDLLAQLKNNGVNTVRLRLWVNPASGHCGFDEVKRFSQQAKSLGFHIWLSVHYSDTWADPAHQMIPNAWQGLAFDGLKDSLRAYTRRVVKEMQPDIIQLGNEINGGLLLPAGDMNANKANCIALLQAGSEAVRAEDAACKIMLHVAGLDVADWFCGQVAAVDYDVLGFSFYPMWHGKSLTDASAKLQALAAKYDKQWALAETAYPFTLDWNDMTNNIVGLSNQLILPEFPATASGQKQFVRAMKEMLQGTKNGMGFCYWGGEWVAWKGPQSTSGSPWENQALFDFNNKALPALTVFAEK